jgi:phosphoadenosine phosphosulfate reductase
VSLAQSWSLNVDTLNRKAWYQRPRPAAAPVDFERRLASAINELHHAAAQSPSVLAHSLSAEDMVLFHLIATHRIAVDAIAIDTGRLHSSAHALWKAAEARYQQPIVALTPSTASLATLSSLNADSEIYGQRTVRELCCNLRKTEPLRRALASKKSWVTGLRRAQSAGRANVPHHEFDTGFGLEKFNPLADWTDDDIWFFIDLERIPVSELYDKGYASIGCDPCTRPIRFDEHPRAGRWWWEHDTGHSASECGIHIVAASHNTARTTNTTHQNKEPA